jgi:hypothetical protein
MGNMEIRKDIKYNDNNYDNKNEANIDMRTKTEILH